MGFPALNFRAALAPPEKIQPSKQQRRPPGARGMTCIPSAPTDSGQARVGSDGTS